MQKVKAKMEYFAFTKNTKRKNEKNSCFSKKQDWTFKPEKQNMTMILFFSSVQQELHTHQRSLTIGETPDACVCDLIHTPLVHSSSQACDFRSVSITVLRLEGELVYLFFLQLKK